MNYNTHQHDTRTTYDNNSKILMTAILSLSFVILLVMILHIYARCVLRPPRHNTPSITTLIQHDMAHNNAVSTTPAKSGLDPIIINMLPFTLFKQRQQSHDHDDIECAVCLTVLEEDVVVRRLSNCNHVFHMACIDKWLLSQSTCPICRSEVSPPHPLCPHDREPPVTVSHLTEVVVVTSEGQEHDHNVQVITNSDNSNNPATKYNNTGNSGSSSSSSFRMGSFRKMISRERSLSSNRLQVFEETDVQSQR